LFKDETGLDAEAQVAAFEDTWHWNQATQATYYDLVTQAPERLGQMVGALYTAVGPNQMMAYLVMMAARLVELHRVLKPTGSLYLHCDPTASHYLKIILDTIFGPQNFRNHIVWQRSDTHNDAKNQYPAISDHILFYGKSNNTVFNRQYGPYAEKTLRNWYLFLEFEDGKTRRMTKKEKETQNIPPGTRRFNAADMTSPNPRPNLMYDYRGYPSPANGWRYSLESMEELDRQGKLLFPSNPNGRIMLKRYLDEQQGVTIGDIWNDISQLRASMSERLGYPTQKPLELLERIVQASSNTGDVVLDPFCGCGTTVAAAQKLGRRWIGIDITHLAIALQKYRLKEMFPDATFDVVGEPTTLGAAQQLAQDDRHQFEWWALSLIKARPVGAQAGSKQGKKGADQGIDGVMSFIDDASNKPKRALVQVKSGKVSSSQIRDLVGTVKREKAQMGIFITLEEPTGPMLKEAATAGFYQSPGFNRAYPTIQIFTIKQLLDGKTVDMPAGNVTFKQAEKAKGDGPEQLSWLK